MSVRSRLHRSVATMIAGVVAARLVAAVWRLATKEHPPEDTEDLDVKTPTALAFAGFLGAATAVAHTVAIRHAERAKIRRAVR